MDTFHLGNRIKIARVEKNLTQAQLARMTGVTRQTISSIETGQFCPSTVLAFRLSRQLDKPVDQLFFLVEASRQKTPLMRAGRRIRHPQTAQRS